MRDGLGMKSLDATYRKFSSRGVDGASGVLGVGLGRQSWLNTVSGSSIEMMRLRGPMGLTRGIEYGKIGAWQRQVDLVALI